MATRKKPLLAAGNDVEWARINQQEAREEAEFAATLTIPSASSSGRNSAIRHSTSTTPFEPVVMAPSEIRGPDLAGVVADANQTGLSRD